MARPKLKENEKLVTVTIRIKPDNATYINSLAGKSIGSKVDDIISKHRKMKEML